MRRAGSVARCLTLSVRVVRKRAFVAERSGVLASPLAFRPDSKHCRPV